MILINHANSRSCKNVFETESHSHIVSGLSEEQANDPSEAEVKKKKGDS